MNMAADAAFPEKHYVKSNSIISLKHRARSALDPLGRIQFLVGKLNTLSLEPYQKMIVSQACHDVLNKSQEHSEDQFSLREHVAEEIHRLSDEELPRYLFYRYRYDVFPQKFQIDSFPPCLQIEPTSICNYRCIFCYQTDKEFTDAKNGHMGSMTYDLFREVIDQAEGVCEAVTLASRGEPLLCREFEKMIKYAAGKFLALKVNTNAWFLDERKAHAILEAEPNTLVFSADAASEPLYSQLRVRGKLERIVKNIRRFRQIQENAYPDSRLITRVSGVRYSEAQNLKEMENFWTELVDQVAFVDYNPWENVYAQKPNRIVAPCSDLWRRMFVWFDGRVNPCDVDFKSNLQVGDVSKDTLSALWRGEKYELLRERHRSKERSHLFPCTGCYVV